MTWINPKGRAFAFLPPAQEPGNNRPGQENQPTPEILPPEKPTTQVLIKQSKPEILPPEKPRLPVLDIPKPPPTDIGPQLDGAVRRFENLLETALQTFDLSEPEGFFDTYIIDRKDHRLNVKIARSARTVELLDNFVNALDAAERAEEKIRRLGRSQQQEYIERLNLAHTAMMSIHRLQLAAAAAQRQDAVETEKANVLIEQYKAEAREHSLRGRPQPAPPPPPPPPEDPRLKQKRLLQQDIDRLKREEAEEIQKITGGKPEHDWSDAVQEEIVRVQNMYDHAREERREELRRFL